MFWNQLAQLIWGTSLLAAQTVPMHIDYKPGNVDEVLTYECAKGVAEILDPSDQPGPVFADLDLVFTSVLGRDGRPLLLFSAGQGNFEIPLIRAGINRLTFDVPVRGTSERRTYYISYLHGDLQRSRVFDLASGRPGPGKGELDYERVQPRRNEALLENLNYQIYTTSQNIVGLLNDGKVHRGQIRNSRFENCDSVARFSPQISKNLRQHLDVVERIAQGPSAVATASRQPASFSERK